MVNNVPQNTNSSLWGIAMKPDACVGSAILFLRGKGAVCIMFLLMLFCPQVDAATYHVKNGGNNANSGLSDTEAWATIGKVNGFRFSPGDTLSLKRGSIFSDETLKSPDVDNFTIRDYGRGDKPRIDANKIQPINIQPAVTMRNLIVKNIDISGQDWTNLKDTVLTITNVDGLVLDGLYADGHRDGGKHGKNAIYVGGIGSQAACKGSIEIRNCELMNYGPAVIPSPGTDFMGIVLANIQEGTVLVHNNSIHNLNADCIHIFHSAAIVTVSGNTLYNGGENSIDVKSSSNVTIRNNQMGREPTFRGQGGSGGGSTVGIHDPGKFGTTKNIVVRSNIFSPGDFNAINVGSCTNVEIHGNQFMNGSARGVRVSDCEALRIGYNTFENMAGSIAIGDKSSNVEVYHNIILNPKTAQAWSTMDGGGIYENNSSSKVTKIYNNTIYNTSGSCRHLIGVACSAGTEIRNNIVYQGLPGNENYGLYVEKYGGPPVVENNCWYNPHRATVVRYRGSDYGLTNYGEWSITHAGDKFLDPSFADPSRGDLTIPDGTPCAGRGARRRIDSPMNLRIQ